MFSHVFGLVGEYISLLLTNQHLEEEPPIVEVVVVAVGFPPLTQVVVLIQYGPIPFH